MGSSMDGADDGSFDDGLELVTSAGPQEPPSVPETGPERHTLILDEPQPQPEAGEAAALPHEDVYQGDGDEIDLIDGVDPQPEYEPALIDLDDESMVIDQPGTEIAPEVVDVPDTLMAVDDYGDVP